jgi:hypothetical protein
MRNEEINDLFLNYLVQRLRTAKYKLSNKGQSQEVLNVAFRPLRALQ